MRVCVCIREKKIVQERARERERERGKELPSV